MDLGLADLRILVTGASGGIGAATARLLAAEGARVAAHYRTNADAAQALADEIGGVAVAADLRDEDDANAMVARAAARLGRLDAVVANAGTWPSDDVPVWDLPLARWRETLDTNLTGTFLTVRSFLRHVHERGVTDEDPAPSVVMVGSTAGEFGEAGHADYAAAKAAIGAGLLRSLKNEIVRLHPHGRVNTVAPGWTVSPMTAETLDAGTVARITATMALGKVATTPDVARAIAWLLSPVAAGHVTGQTLTVAGGMEGRLLRPPG